MIKYKQGESETIFYKVDTATGQKISFSSNAKPKTSGWGMNKEMQAWVEAGNIIEKRHTPGELAQKEAEELEAAKTAYIGLRQSEYPSVGDQLDYIYHNGIAAWKTDIIKPIKDKYPKL